MTTETAPFAEQQVGAAAVAARIDSQQSPVVAVAVSIEQQGDSVLTAVGLLEEQHALGPLSHDIDE